MREAGAPEVLTGEEAAALLRMCPHTVAKLAKTGKLPGRKLGREWRFVRTELIRWLNGDRAA
jgi:excisionase family DNA binding protein